MRRELSASDALRRFDVFECDTVDIQVTVLYDMWSQWDVGKTKFLG